MLLEEVDGGVGNLFAHEDVKDEPSAILRLDEGHVRHIIAPDLIYALAYLEKTRLDVALGVAPKAGVHGRGCLASVVDEFELGHAPYLSGGVGDVQVGRCLDESALGILQFSIVVEVETAVPFLVLLCRGGRGSLRGRGVVGVVGSGVVRRRNDCILGLEEDEGVELTRVDGLFGAVFVKVIALGVGMLHKRACK